MPPRPLHPGVRQRRNVKTSRAELVVLPPEARAAIDVPELPADRLWDPKTSDFWRDAWQSPMRLEWDPGDLHKLLMLAYALDEFYSVASNMEMKQLDRAYAMSKLSKAIIDLGAKLGLDPYARRSLDWMLVQTEESEARTALTRERTQASRQARSIDAKTVRKRRGLKALE